MFARSHFLVRFTAITFISILAILLIVNLMLTLLAPWAAARYAESWFAEQASGQQLSIGEAKLSFLQGKLKISDVELVQQATSTEPTIPNLESVSFESLRIDWQPMALFDKQFKGNAELKGFAVKVTDAPKLSLAGLSLNEIFAIETEQRINQVQVFDLNVGEGAESIALESYEIENVALAHNVNGPQEPISMALTMGIHQFAGLAFNAQKKQLAETSSTAEHESDANAASSEIEGSAIEGSEVKSFETESSESQSAIHIQIAGIQQKEGSESVIRFVDHSVTPVATIEATLKVLEIGALDSADLTKKVPFNIETSLDEYNEIAVLGEMGLLDDQPEGTAILKIKQLNLVPFNGYVAQAIGYHVQKGSLKLDVDLSIEEAQLGGEANILLRNSEFLPVDEATIDRVGKQLSMPVDTVLSILRDDNNNIELDMPLSGDINDPNVGLDDLMNQLSLLALKEAATYYLKQALQPYGTLISLSSYAGSYLMAIRLDDLTYSTFKADLTTENTEYLTKVAGMMADKEALELQVCGFAGEEEISYFDAISSEGLSSEGLGAQGSGSESSKELDSLKEVEDLKKKYGEVQFANWQALAKQRSDNVKLWFKNSYPALVERVTVCQPQKSDDALVVMGF